MDRLSRRAVIATLAAALVLAVAPGVAQAAEEDKITSSTITTPAADPTYVMVTEGTMLTVSGSLMAKDKLEKAVNVLCYYETSSGVTESYFLGEAPVTYSGTTKPFPGTFSTVVTLTPELEEPEHTCTLRAVPERELFAAGPATLAPFGGPRLSAGWFRSQAVAAGPNAGHIYNFEASSVQLNGYGAYESFSGDGIVKGVPQNPSTFASGGNLFAGNDGFEAIARPGVQVDGVPAFGPSDTFSLLPKSAEFAGLPAHRN